MQFLNLILKGFIIGAAKIVPGVSGAVLAMSMGIYEKAINAINNFFDKPKDNFKYLFSLAIGVMLAIILMSRIIIYLLYYYYLPTMLLFIGLIFGGMRSLLKNKSLYKFRIVNFILLLISFFSVFLLSLVGKQHFFINDLGHFNFFIFINIGLIDAITMVIPGISGTAVMMLLGCYNLLLDLLSSLNSVGNVILNLPKLLPFVFGVSVGIIILTKLMNYLFSRHREKTYIIIMGFSLGSILILFLDCLKSINNLFEIFLSLLLMVIGYLFSKKLSN